MKMNKSQTIEIVDEILFDIRWAGIKIGDASVYSDYVDQEQFEQFIKKLDEIREDLYTIQKELDQ